MAIVKEIKQIGKLLEKIGNIPEIEKAEVINIPEDVEADVGIKIIPKNPKDRYKIIEKLNDLEWEIYDKTGSLPVIYWEFEYKIIK